MAMKEEHLRNDIQNVIKAHAKIMTQLETLEINKMDKTEFRKVESMHVREIEKVRDGFKDVLNRLVDNENYIDKYLPYNMFVQYIELLHFALDVNQVKKFRDYERSKMQIYLATIIQDIKERKDKRWVDKPPNVRDCDCALGSFKNILYKATKLNERNRQVLA